MTEPELVAAYNAARAAYVISPSHATARVLHKRALALFRLSHDYHEVVEEASELLKRAETKGHERMLPTIAAIIRSVCKKVVPARGKRVAEPSTMDIPTAVMAAQLQEKIAALNDLVAQMQRRLVMIESEIDGARMPDPDQEELPLVGRDALNS